MKRILTALSLCLLAGGQALAQSTIPPGAADVPYGLYNVTPPTATDKVYVPLQVDVNGNLKTTGSGAGGAITANQGTAAADSGAWPVKQPDVRAVDQTINSATPSAAYTVAVNGQGEVGFTVTGLTASGATLTAECTNNIGAASPTWGGCNTVSGTALSSTLTADGSYRVEAGGRTGVRLRVTTPGTGTITVSSTAASTSSLVTLAQSLSAGANLIGATWTAARIDVTPTVQNAAYASGNDIGGLVSFTLPRTASGYLQSVGVQFIGGATTAINAFCFDSNPTGSTFTDKSTFTIAAADEAKRINKTGYSLTPAAVVGDTVTGAAVDNLAKPFNSTGTIYCAYASTGTFTPASVTDMRVNITYVQSAQ